jgi:uncharacterized protein YjbI with pentapeptide repeats
MIIMRNIRNYPQHINEYQLQISDRKGNPMSDISVNDTYLAIKGQNLEIPDFTGIKIEDHHFYDCTFDTALWNDTDLSGCDFRKCEIQGDATDSSFKHCSFDDSSSMAFFNAKDVSFYGSSFDDTDWHNCYFEDCNFRNASGTFNPDDSKFVNCDFSEGNLIFVMDPQYQLGPVSFINCKFENKFIRSKSDINFSGAILKGSSFARTRFRTIVPEGFTGNYIKFIECDLSDTDFTGCKIPVKQLFIQGSNLSGSNLLENLDISKIDDLEDFLDGCTGIPRKIQRMLGMKGMFSKDNNNR